MSKLILDIAWRLFELCVSFCDLFRCGFGKAGLGVGSKKENNFLKIFVADSANS